MRKHNRACNQLREVKIIPHFMPNAAGSCLVCFGRTRVLVTASVTEGVPPFLLEKGQGWVTAEYAMLPGSTRSRKQRERGKADSRSIEIQRLVGRSLRSAVDLSLLDGYTVYVDCDVIEADGGTRTAAITGGFVALVLAIQTLGLKENPIRKYLAAVSAGIVQGRALLDLCYEEDSRAEADMNYVGTEDGQISEIQIAGEARSITEEEFASLLALCKQGVQELMQKQKEIIGG